MNLEDRVEAIDRRLAKVEGVVNISLIVLVAVLTADIGMLYHFLLA